MKHCCIVQDLVRYILKSNFSVTHTHNFKGKPEFTDHNYLIKMFTFVVLKVPEMLWAWQVKMIDQINFQ